MRNVVGAVALLALAILPALAVAGARTVRLAAATIRFDPDRFEVTSASPDRADFAPHGNAARDLAPVELRVYADEAEASCAELARRAFAVGHYDEHAIGAAAISVGGIEGARFATRTRCRNATPPGEVACVKTAGRAYVLAAVQPGCGGHPFSAADALGEIAAGITFDPPPR